MSTPHARITDELRDLAQQHALGTLSDSDRREFERHLQEGCELCAAEVRVAQALIGDMTLAESEPRSAPHDVKERLLARIRGERGDESCESSQSREKPARSPVQTWKSWQGSQDAAGSGSIDRFVAHDDGAFEPTGAKGVSVRRLHVDRARGFTTMLVRMEAGSSYPGHRHGGLEECYVLSGDLRHGDRVMRGGDYEVVSEGSKHGKQWTEEGCLLLIHSSLHDQLLE